MIIDGFLFFNELDLLEIRLEIMNPFVDKFVIVESDTTFSGIHKEFILENELDRFSKYKDKIIYHKVFYSDKIYENTWQGHQRNEIYKGIEKINNLKEDDIIIISDLDEIPDLSDIDLRLDTVNTIVTYFYYFYLNYRIISAKWKSQCILTMDCLNKIYDNKPEYVRRGILPGNINIRESRNYIQNKGWHFSYLYGDNRLVENIQQKVRSFSQHQDYNKEEYMNAITLETKIKNMTDIFNRDYTYEVITDLSYLPRYILNNIDKYSHLIKK